MKTKQLYGTFLNQHGEKGRCSIALILRFTVFKMTFESLHGRNRFGGRYWQMLPLTYTNKMHQYNLFKNGVYLRNRNSFSYLK